MISHCPKFLCHFVSRLLVAPETKLISGPVLEMSSSANRPVPAWAASQRQQCED